MRRVILCFIAVSGVIVAWQEAPREMARWHQARAEVFVARQDIASAIGQLDKALKSDNSNPHISQVRARYKLAMKDLNGGLDDINRTIELAGESHRVSLLIERSEVLQRLERHDEAIEDWNSIVEKSRNLMESDTDEMFTAVVTGLTHPLDMALNARAYIRARGNRQLQEGLDDIHEAIRLLESETYRKLHHRLGYNFRQTRANYYDTRGYLLYLLDQPALALQDLSLAIQWMNSSFGYAMARIQTHPLDGGSVAREWNSFVEGLAVIYFHRALVHDRLGNKLEVDADLHSAAELGYNPEDGVW